MHIMSKGHAAAQVGSCLVVFDIDTFQSRGGAVSDDAIVGQNGVVEVPDEVGQFLVASQAAIQIDERQPSGDDEPSPETGEPGTGEPNETEQTEEVVS